MASAKKAAKTPSGDKDTKRGLTDTQRWVLGAFVFTFGLFLLVAVISYYFCWSSDQNFVRWGDIRRADAGAVTNHTGKTGAVLANYIVGEWFGVFGIIIPVVLMIFGLRIINYRPAMLRRSVRISLLIMIAGSLTLGFLLGTRWAVFGTGLGGAHGIVVSRWLVSFLGTVGTGLLLLLFWVLTGVYINSRRTISAVNRVGKGIYEGSVKMGGAVVGHAAELVTGRADDILGGLDDTEQEMDNGPEEEEDEESTGPVPVLQAQNERFEDMSVTATDRTGPAATEHPAPGGIEIVGGVAVPDREPEPDVFEITDSRYADEEIIEPRAADLGSMPDVVVLGGAATPQETQPGAAGEITTVDNRYAGGVGEYSGEYPAGGGQGAGGGFAVPGPEVFTLDGPEIYTIGDPSSDGGNTDTGGGFEVVDLGTGDTGVMPVDAGSGHNGGGIWQADGGNNDTGGELQVSGGREYSVGGALSVGGVVESVSAGSGVTPDDRLEVVVAGHSDAQLDEDDIEDRLYDPTLELSKYQKPPVELLEDHSVDVQVTEEEIYENKNNIVRTLENFGIKIDKIKATIGPTVTLYEIVPTAGVKISKIKNLEDDIALSLKALGIRIIAPMPGKGTIGIEVPNKDKEIVSMYSVVRTMKFQECGYELPVVLGKTISNETFVIDLAKMPHLLVAGATGQGKSVGLNAIITSLLYRKHPAELKFVLVDPKRVELSLYGKIERGFLAKMESEDDAILTDTQKVVYTLNALCTEMSDRYELLRQAEVKKLSEYNDKFLKRRLNPRKGHRFMPYIVVVIDEFADMIMTAGREVEAPITRLAQLARAVGIHLVIATQRPDVKVITGLIKANFPARIAFRVMSMVDSRTIIDQPGANQLIGRGDMLMSLNGELTRVQCAFIDTPEIEKITEHIKKQTEGYPGPYPLPDYQPDGDAAATKTADLGQVDSMFEEVARFVVQNQQGSTSSIQRRFYIGYNRAGRIMDQLEAAGIVGRAEGSKPREVLITDVASMESILGNIEAEGL
ncbi:MAG: DNA translocase FtsK [Alistipes sp.]|nr:DNA translocase FtsK [Alistipes sp.]